MNIVKRLKRDGISLKTTHRVMIPLTVLMTITLLVGIAKTGWIYQRLTAASKQYAELESAANDLMDASDYLTDKVQRFTVTMDPVDMDAYFDETDHVRRREKAVEKMHQIVGDSEAFLALSAALDESRTLMETEFTAMKIICAESGITFPAALTETALPPGVSVLPKAERVRLAQDMVHDEAYYAEKLSIHSNLERCMRVLVEDAEQMQSTLSVQLRNHLLVIVALVIVQSLAMLVILWMTSFLGINPIIQGVQKIRDNQEIPVTGAYEFRYLAKTYNKMYEAFQQSIQHLNYDASHDKLTGLYNRAGYDVVKKSIDLKTTAVLLIDADKFKEINDTYGHAAGDAVLRKIADSLKHTFRHEDYICRIGGDEFVVFMLRMEERREELIRLKTDLINNRLSDESDGIPKISISIGVAFGDAETDIDTLVQHADEALYQMKSAGRKGCVFYTDMAMCV